MNIKLLIEKTIELETACLGVYHPFRHSVRIFRHALLSSIVG